MKILIPQLETVLEVFNWHCIHLVSPDPFYVLIGSQMELGFDFWKQNSGKDLDQMSKNMVYPQKYDS